MAGLVPAIHVLQNIRMAGGYVYILTNRSNGILYVGVTRAWKVRKIVVDNPEWSDLYPTIVQ
jgi:predicted GIY-YIG superfamily endonuclease